MAQQFEVPAPPAANAVRNFKSKSGTRIIELLVPLCFRSSCQSMPRRITNFGNGALAALAPPALQSVVAATGDKDEHEASYDRKVLGELHHLDRLLLGRISPESVCDQGRGGNKDDERQRGIAGADAEQDRQSTAELNDRCDWRQHR